MLSDMLQNVTATAIFGCLALLLVQNRPIREILRIAVGVLMILSAAQAFLGETRMQAWVSMPEMADVSALEQEQTRLYQEALAAETEALIEKYFVQQDMSVDAKITMQNDAVERVILCPEQTYDWTEKDADAFTAWSGITQEKQEWIWNS